jgi:pantoate--beta-alanine ligase
LFSLDIAYFGQKDYQQATIIRKMVGDLNMNLTIKVLPTVREPDGLAMSSRNRYLSTAQRQHANRLYKSLDKAKQIMLAGETDSKRVVRTMQDIIRTIPDSKIDYIAMVDPQTLNPIAKLKKGSVILLAVFVGKTRLIDNIIV